MISSNEKNVCSVLRETWRSIITLVEYLSTFLRKMLSEIQALVNRIKNTIISRILSTIRDIRDVISNFLGLQTIDNNSARQEFCRILYACQPAIEEISKFVSPELFAKMFGPDSIKTIDLSKYGIPQLSFNSKFELFEYVACRLSLRGLLDNITQNIINQLLNFLSNFDKYLDINWWLANTVWGRLLNRLINEYEDFFNNRIKPFLDKLIPYLNCTFALCDFTVSTNNFFDDFQTKFKAERKQTTNLSFEFKIAKERLYSDLTDSLHSAQTEMKTFKSTLMGPIEASKPLFHNRTTGEQISSEATTNKDKTGQTTPYSTDELSVIKNNVANRKTSLTPGIPEHSFTDIRNTIRLSSPNSKVD